MAGKLNLAVSALRWGEEIRATVQAVLPDGHLAEVTDIYPGGRIVYANDPGEAQIFVRIRRADGAQAAAGRWEESRDIPHCRPHQDLAVIAEFEGRTFIARTPIHRFKARSGAAADPAALRRAIGLPPPARVGMGATGSAAKTSPAARVRYSNCPAPPLSA
ncbi:MAG TPA: hypothetical protein VLK25_05350 [Allosphingosinicella sp.]|nr:hypothetical protein [Allosphingosinicella sp.]